MSMLDRRVLGRVVAARFVVSAFALLAIGTASLRVDARTHPPQPPKKDYCDDLRRQMIRRAS